MKKKILFAGSECMPFAATGGLGDVLGSLPAAVKKAGGEDVDVRVVLPLYDAVSDEWRSQMKTVAVFDVQLAWRHQYCGVLSLQREGVIYYFIDNEYYFNRTPLYGHYDDGERYAYFSKAILESLPHIGFFPDILHANDWQTAPSVVYLKYKYGLMPDYSGIKSVFTIHNIGYQGIYGFEILGDVFDLPASDGMILDYNGDINLMKGAIMCADKVSTVSPTYAKEILYPKYSHGLHYVLEQNKGKLYGILNGIDREYYNPAKDTELFANFSYRKPEGKAVNKSELQRLLGLPVRNNVPMIAVISRLVDHKGLDLLTLAADDILKDDVQLVILGKGDYYYENFFWHLAERHRDKVVTILDYNKELSKKIYAGADLFLMPSRSEPCGLAQMIASRYGTVPIVRETGGLYDSIKDIGWEGGGNGFTFAPYSAWELYKSVERAINVYRDKETWANLVDTVMKWDFSWKKSAKEYIRLLYD